MTDRASQLFKDAGALAAKGSKEDAADKYLELAYLCQTVGDHDGAMRAFHLEGDNRRVPRLAAHAYMNEIRWCKRPEDAVHIFEGNVLPNLTTQPRVLAAYHESFAKMMFQLTDLSLAIKHNLLAAKLFATEFLTASQLKVLRTAASLSMGAREYVASAALFEEAATVGMEHELTRFGAKVSLMNAVVCTLAAGDTAGAEAMLARAHAIDYAFKGSRECNFCTSLVAAKRRGAEDEIGAAIDNFVAICPQDQWMMAALRSI